MNQKSSKPQLNELGNKLQDKSSTSAGGNSDSSIKRPAKDLECASGVCLVTWKPDLLKR